MLGRVSYFCLQLYFRTLIICNEPVEDLDDELGAEGELLVEVEEELEAAGHIEHSQGEGGETWRPASWRGRTPLRSPWSR